MRRHDEIEVRRNAQSFGAVRPCLPVGVIVDNPVPGRFILLLSLRRFSARLQAITCEEYSQVSPMHLGIPNTNSPFINAYSAKFRNNRFAGRRDLPIGSQCDRIWSLYNAGRSKGTTQPEKTMPASLVHGLAGTCLTRLPSSAYCVAIVTVLDATPPMLNLRLTAGPVVNPPGT